MSVDVRPFPEVVDADRAGVDPPYDHLDYVGTRLRAPKQPLVIIPTTLTELTGPAFGESAVDPRDADLTRQHAGDPLGERIVLERARPGQRRQAAPRAARRDLAGERRRPVPRTRSTTTTRRSTRTSPGRAAA